MPQASTIKRARADKRAGKSASTQAGEFVKDEIKRIRAGKHGAKNAKQAIAIGLSEARRAGVAIPAKKKAAAKSKKASPKRSTGTTKRRAAARRTTTARRSASTRKTTSARRSAAALKALRKQPTRSASHLALSRQAHGAARKRTKAARTRAKSDWGQSARCYGRASTLTPLFGLDARRLDHGAVLGEVAAHLVGQRLGRSRRCRDP